MNAQPSRRGERAAGRAAEGTRRHTRRPAGTHDQTAARLKGRCSLLCLRPFLSLVVVACWTEGLPNCTEPFTVYTHFKPSEDQQHGLRNCLMSAKSIDGHCSSPVVSSKIQSNPKTTNLQQQATKTVLCFHLWLPALPQPIRK